MDERMAMSSWFHKAGAASENALLAADQSDLDEMLGWARRGAERSPGQIENMVTNNKISSPVHVHSGICKHKAKF